MKIFLDLDGPLSNFVKGASDLFGVNYDELVSTWPPGEYDMPSVLKITEDQFYNVLTLAGEDFWANLPIFDHAKRLLRRCRDIAPTFVLTKPTRHSECLSGKVRWMQTHFHPWFNDYVITAHKELCAGPGTILIDDHDKNCERFRAAGGNAIVWPTFTNSRHELKDVALEVVLNELTEWSGRVRNN